MTLKEKLRLGKTTIGSWLTFEDSNVCEMMARQGGFDWLVVDMEHTATGAPGQAHLIQLIDLCGLDSLVRVGANDQLLIKRALDAGATGIIVPQVNSADDARRAVSAAYYPPVGERGAGLFRAQAYGDDFNGYWERAARDTVVIVQIEHYRGVENLQEIMATDGVDGFLIGPYDLSASLGRPGEFDHPDVAERLKVLATYAETGNKAAGIHVVQPNRNDLETRSSEGFSFIAYGTDMLFLGTRLAVDKDRVKALNRGV